MPAARWTTKEQLEFLNGQLPSYLENCEAKSYDWFWPGLNTAWFVKWPERSVLFPNFPVEIPLTPEQNEELGKAVVARKNQLRTWFRWRTSGSHKVRVLKKQTSVFDALMEPKGTCSLTQGELYSLEYYDKRIKPHVEAEKQAGNITTVGGQLSATCKLSNELLAAESDDVKLKIKEIYELQKRKRSTTEVPGEVTDPGEIQRAIDDLPYVLKSIAVAIKQHTHFTVSFICAGPDLSKNWGITSLSCHPGETPQGNTFTTLFPKEDNILLAVYQDYAELLFHKQRLVMTCTT
ncbi:hypothetical protein PAXRUDRAFT_165274 [Paxillus rubicundulus Ve08.2h10]|uniref:Uncharacterized protein n=1 Tax=Paxillus rubicundulus Ve08.2h10 TaxID=930991 RepID=A0A0D0D363_9AGAM|nr:hypothetical protein PAXRUDRAFT_165274 [Paxillus rubicundulus Ve08.2h10]